MNRCSKWKTPDRSHTVGVVIRGTVAIALHAKTAPCDLLRSSFLYELASAMSKASAACLYEPRPDVWVVDKGDFVLVKVNAYAVNVPKHRLHSNLAALVPFIVRRLQRFMFGWRQQHRNHLICKARLESSEIDSYRWGSESAYVAMSVGYMIGQGRESELPPPAALVELDENRVKKTDATIYRLLNVSDYVQPLLVMETL